jgi:hypothetical protein
LSNKSDFFEVYGSFKICVISSEKEQKKRGKRKKKMRKRRKKMRKRGVEGGGTSTVWKVL